MTKLPPPPRLPDLDREQTMSWIAASVRWGKEPDMTSMGMLDPEYVPLGTMAPPRRR